jgi:hypothetical protein
MENIKYKINNYCSYELFKTNINDTMCNIFLRTAIRDNTRNKININTVINTLLPIISNMHNTIIISTQKENTL